MSSRVDIYAEEGVLSSLLTDPSALEDISGFLNEGDFYEPRHQRIYAAILELFRAGLPIRKASVANVLRDKGILSEIGGIEYIASFTDPTALYASDADALTYAEIVKDESLRRKIKNVGYSMTQESDLDSGVSVDQLLGDLQKELRHLNEERTNERNIANVADLLDESEVRLAERAERSSGLQGIPSGLVDLDANTTGFCAGQFIIIAARPGMGKSTLAVDFARTAAFRADCSVMLFSLEMGQDEIMDRVLSAESNVRLSDIRTGQISEGDHEKIRETYRLLSDKNFVIDTSPKITIDHIRTVATAKMQTPEGLDMIIVDYLQLMSSPGSTRPESRQQEVSEFSRSLKMLARELNIPVIALSQFNRGPENRTDKLPRMSDMRESGSLEQDADIVIILHRPEGDSNEQPVIILAKNRNGPNDIHIPVAPLLAYSKFGNGSGIYRAQEEPVSEEDSAALPPDTGEGVYPAEAPSHAPDEAQAAEPTDEPPVADFEANMTTPAW